ncbi:MAG: NgoMIV family type II restriction endonuclease [Candidatus Aphodosoma sp.]
MSRKGHLPHIVVITGEPLSPILASLAFRNRRIYRLPIYFAQYELIEAVKNIGAEDALDNA